MLSKYVNSEHCNWDVYLPYLLYAYHSSMQESTKEVPYYLLFGRSPVLPIDLSLGVSPKALLPAPRTYGQELQTQLHESFALARANIERAQQRQQCNYDATHAETPEYQEGELVWLYCEPRPQHTQVAKLMHP